MTGEAADGGEAGIGAGVDSAADQLDLVDYLADNVAATGREAQSGVKRLRRGAGQLSDGLGELADGGGQLVSGFDQLRAGGRQLSSGVGQLSEGADALADGLGQAQHGRRAPGRRADAGRIGLPRAGQRPREVQRGVRDQGKTAFSGGDDLANCSSARRGCWGRATSTLAAIDRADPSMRSKATLLVDVDRGGQVARMLVVPTTGPDSDATQRTRERLEREAEVLADDTGSEVVVAGPAAALHDDDNAARGQLPILILLLSVLTIVMLAPLVRSIVLGVVAAVLNALVAGATLGVLALVFDQLATIAAAVVIAIAFGLAIGYELQLLTRVREERSRTATPVWRSPTPFSTPARRWAPLR